MGRKRKVSIADEEKENEDGSVDHDAIQLQNSPSATNNTSLHHGPMYTIMSNVQLNETFHKKYVKEMQQLYLKMDHDAFMFTFIKMIKSAMEADEGNDYAKTTLLFCAKFVGSYNSEDTHPILVDMFKWLLTTISNNPHIRFRLCQFVNMILNALGVEAALDDVICDNIMDYMLARLRDVSPNVRVQAILALQRLQVPDNPDDPVLRSYQFHLCSDPSPRVRQAVITSMGRNYNTIPYILDRLWDVDEKVRRHTYLHMSSYPVKSYKVSQRLMLMEQGLNDRSEMVRKVVTNIMLQQWIESYQKDIVLLVSGLKLDSNETEIDRFRKIARLTLKEIFKRLSKEELVACIPSEEDGEFNKCIPLEKLTIEVSLYWQCLTEYLQEELADEFDLVVPELSTFCAYVARFCQTQRDDMDKFEQMEFQYILLALVEILLTYDLGDETGRENLKKLISAMLKTYYLDEKVIGVIVKCAENLIDNQNVRLQYFVEIIQEICDLSTPHYDLVHDRNLINELMAKSSDAALNLKLSSLKVKILDLEEQEMYFVQRKDYVNAHKITEEKNACSEEYSNLLKPLLKQYSNSDLTMLPHQQTKKAISEAILKCLQVAFHMVVSDNVHSLTPNVCKLYNDFICRHLASNQIAIRDWALKCGTAYSMLYETLAKDVFEELYSQFYKNHNIRIWKTSIGAIFELLDRYGMEKLIVQEQTNKSKKTCRQLYNTLEFLDAVEDPSTSSIGQGVDIIFMMSHFLDTCDDVCIVSAIVKGFCRLILRGHIKSGEIIEKLLLRYFNPSTDDEVNQLLGVFLENLIQRKMQDLLYPCLLPTITTVLSAPYDSPLQDIRPENIIRFVMDATRQEFCVNNSNIHNKLAGLFLQEMQCNVDNKDLCRLLAKEIITLELDMTDNQLKNNMQETAEQLIKCDFDPRTVKYLINFKDMLDGKFIPATKSVNMEGIDEEDKSDDENFASINVERTTSDGAHKEPRKGIPDEARNGTQEETRDAMPEERRNGMPEEARNDLPEDLSDGVLEELNTTRNRIPSTPSAPPSASVVDRFTTPLAPRLATGVPASVPTTYGRENRVGQHYLRKSLNTPCRRTAVAESEEGPSRPAKIRIEARIDSDKKMSKNKERITEERTKPRARRSLRVECERVENDTDHETDKRANDKGPVKSKATPGPKKSKQKQQESNKKGERPRQQSEIEEIGLLRRSKRTRSKAVNMAIQKEKEVSSRAHSPVDKAAADVATETEGSNDSEVIPPTPPPPACDEMQQSSVRLRRMRACLNCTNRNITNRSPPSDTPSKTYTKNNSKEPTRNDNEDNSSSLVATPLRNGRKRIFRASPTPSLSSDITVLSPARKQNRMDPSDKSSKNMKSAKKVIPRRSQRRSSVSAVKVMTPNGGSPSSSKENEQGSPHTTLTRTTSDTSSLNRLRERAAPQQNSPSKRLSNGILNHASTSNRKRQSADNNHCQNNRTVPARRSARLSLEKIGTPKANEKPIQQSASALPVSKSSSRIPLRIKRKRPSVVMSTNNEARSETGTTKSNASHNKKITAPSSIAKKDTAAKTRLLPSRLALPVHGLATSKVATRRRQM